MLGVVLGAVVFDERGVLLGGEARLTLRLSERSWRTWLPWATLGAGVLLLGWMATRLARQMKGTG